VLRCCRLHRHCLLLQAGLLQLLWAAVAAAALPVAAELRQPGLPLLVPVEAVQYLLNPALHSDLHTRRAQTHTNSVEAWPLRPMDCDMLEHAGSACANG
jgi:hypothetical protein